MVVDHAIQPIRTIICGAGLCGLSTAIGLRQAGHEVTILERASVLQEIGAGINVPPNATRLLERWGILEKVKQVAIQPAVANMRQWQTGEVLSAQDMHQELFAKYSSPYWVVHRGDLHKVLLTTALELGARLHLGCHIVSIDTQDPSVTLADDTRYEADLILCSDGERSFGRTVVDPDSMRFFDSGDHVFRITADINEVKKIGLSELVEPPAINSWNGPNGFALTYNLQRDNLLNIVLTASHPVGSREMPGPEPVTVGTVREVFRGWDDRFQALLTASKNCSQWTLFKTPEPKKWVSESGKFALIGDAAHAMVPFIGQGAALAFEDAALITNLLSRLADTAKIRDVLDMYENCRKRRCRDMRNKSERLRNVLVCESEELRRERDRQLLDYRSSPFDGYPNFLADPVLQDWMFSYDANVEAEKAWKRYQAGK